MDPQSALSPAFKHAALPQFRSVHSSSSVAASGRSHSPRSLPSIESAQSFGNQQRDGETHHHQHVQLPIRTTTTLSSMTSPRDGGGYMETSSRVGTRLMTDSAMAKTVTSPSVQQQTHNKKHIHAAAVAATTTTSTSTPNPPSSSSSSTTNNNKRVLTTTTQRNSTTAADFFAGARSPSFFMRNVSAGATLTIGRNGDIVMDTEGDDDDEAIGRAFQQPNKAPLPPPRTAQGAGPVELGPSNTINGIVSGWNDYTRFEEEMQQQQQQQPFPMRVVTSSLQQQQQQQQQPTAVQMQPRIILVDSKNKSKQQQQRKPPFVKPTGTVSFKSSAKPNAASASSSDSSSSFAAPETTRSNNNSNNTHQRPTSILKPSSLSSSSSHANANSSIGEKASYSAATLLTEFRRRLQQNGTLGDDDEEDSDDDDDDHSRRTPLPFPSNHYFSNLKTTLKPEIDKGHTSSSSSSIVFTNQDHLNKKSDDDRRTDVALSSSEPSTFSPPPIPPLILPLLPPALPPTDFQAMRDAAAALIPAATRDIELEVATGRLFARGEVGVQASTENDDQGGGGGDMNITYQVNNNTNKHKRHHSLSSPPSSLSPSSSNYFSHPPLGSPSSSPQNAQYHSSLASSSSSEATEYHPKQSAALASDNDDDAKQYYYYSASSLRTNGNNAATTLLPDDAEGGAKHHSFHHHHHQYKYQQHREEASTLLSSPRPTRQGNHQQQLRTVAKRGVQAVHSLSPPHPVAATSYERKRESKSKQPTNRSSSAVKAPSRSLGTYASLARPQRRASIAEVSGRAAPRGQVPLPPPPPPPAASPRIHDRSSSVPRPQRSVNALREDVGRKASAIKPAVSTRRASISGGDTRTASVHKTNTQGVAAATTATATTKKKKNASSTSLPIPTESIINGKTNKNNKAVDYLQNLLVNLVSKGAIPANAAANIASTLLTSASSSAAAAAATTAYSNQPNGGTSTTANNNNNNHGNPVGVVGLLERFATSEEQLSTMRNRSSYLENVVHSLTEQLQVRETQEHLHQQQQQQHPELSVLGGSYPFSESIISPVSMGLMVGLPSYNNSNSTSYNPHAAPAIAASTTASTVEGTMARLATQLQLDLLDSATRSESEELLLLKRRHDELHRQQTAKLNNDDNNNNDDEEDDETGIHKTMSSLRESLLAASDAHSIISSSAPVLSIENADNSHQSAGAEILPTVIMPGLVPQASVQLSSLFAPPSFGDSSSTSFGSNSNSHRGKEVHVRDLISKRISKAQQDLTASSTMMKQEGSHPGGAYSSYLRHSESKPTKTATNSMLSPSAKMFSKLLRGTAIGASIANNNSDSPSSSAISATSDAIASKKNHVEGGDNHGISSSSSPSSKSSVIRTTVPSFLQSRIGTAAYVTSSITDDGHHQSLEDHKNTNDDDDDEKVSLDTQTAPRNKLSDAAVVAEARSLLSGGNGSVCSECGRVAASKRCHECAEDFCDEGCFEKVHGNGKRRTHLWTPLLNSTTTIGGGGGGGVLFSPSRASSSSSLYSDATRVLTSKAGNAHVLMNTNVVSSSFYDMNNRPTAPSASTPPLPPQTGVDSSSYKLSNEKATHEVASDRTLPPPPPPSPPPAYLLMADDPYNPPTGIVPLNKKPDSTKSPAHAASFKQNMNDSHHIDGNGMAISNNSHIGNEVVLSRMDLLRSSHIPFLPTTTTATSGKTGGATIPAPPASLVPRATASSATQPSAAAAALLSGHTHLLHLMYPNMSIASTLKQAIVNGNDHKPPSSRGVSSSASPSPTPAALKNAHPFSPFSFDDIEREAAVRMDEQARLFASKYANLKPSSSSLTAEQLQQQQQQQQNGSEINVSSTTTKVMSQQHSPSQSAPNARPTHSSENKRADKNDINSYNTNFHLHNKRRSSISGGGMIGGGGDHGENGNTGGSGAAHNNNFTDAYEQREVRMKARAQQAHTKFVARFAQAQASSSSQKGFVVRLGRWPDAGTGSSGSAGGGGMRGREGALTNGNNNESVPSYNP